MKAKRRKATARKDGRKDKARAPRRQPRPAGDGTHRQRRAAEEPITPKLKKVLALFPIPELAKICGVTRQGVHQWTDFPAKHALAVEKASAGKLTKEYLAPNFYPRPA